jgi:beta-lactamase regulating signal transducer with metallopeptidase domain/HEAT repeat protein
MLSTFLSTTPANISLLVMLAKATIILVAALGITVAMQRTSAGARHLVWLVAVTALLLIPAVTAWAPLPLRILPVSPTTWSVVETPSTRGTPVAAALPAAPSDPAVTEVPVVANVPAVHRDAPSAAARAWTAVKGMSALELLFGVWAVVMFAVIASLAWAGLAVRRIVREASPLVSHAWLAPLWEVSDRLGLEEAPRLLRSDEAKMPFACGMFHPTIVLPAECESWSTERRQAVLLHELAHVRRHDLVGHTLARLVCAVYWFHPLAWTAAKQLRSESERACDDLALSCGTRATDYAEHLLEIVTSVRGDATPLVALAMARRKEFEGRMLAILDPELPHSSPSRRQSAALIGSLALIAFTVSAVSPTARIADAAPVTVRVAPPAVRAAHDTEFDQNSLLVGPMRTDSITSTRYDKTISKVIDKNVQQDMRTALRVNTDVVAIGEAAGLGSASSAGSSADIGNAVAFGQSAGGGKAVSATSMITVDGQAIGKLVGTAAMAAIQSALNSASAQQKGADDRPALLAKILRTDTSLTIRQTAAWGLREYAGVPVATAALVNAVQHDAEACVREMSAWALADGDDNDATVTAALSGALRSDVNANVRRTAAWSLGRVGGSTALPALTAALSDDYPEVRQRALWAIGNVEPKEAPKEVVSKLRDKDARVRELAAWALFRIEDPNTAPALETALRSETDKNVQIADLRALATLGERSVDAIRGLVESPDPRIRNMAVRALAGGHATGPWPWPWPEPRPYP